MILALDVGNSQIYGGLHDGNKFLFHFRKNSQNSNSSDEFGIFLKLVLKENGYDPKLVKRIAVCSVVPHVMHSLRGACQKYFNCEPFFLQAGVRTGLKIKYRNPLEVGADRIANSIAATQIFPNQNLVIVDFGTATTFCAVSKEKDYLGGLIMPGLRISMEALENRTAKLPSVEIKAVDEIIAKSTVESIQGGIYWSNVFAAKSIGAEITKNVFKGEKTLLIGTGGFSNLFQKEKVFDHVMPDLVLSGLIKALEMNPDVAINRTSKTTLILEQKENEFAEGLL